MSDITFDILNQGDKFILRENKDQSISKVMKGRYDFESFLLEDIQSSKDDSMKNDTSFVANDVLLKDLKYSQISKDESRLATNEILYSSQNINNGDKSINLNNAVKEIKLSLENVLKQEQSAYIANSQNKTANLNRNNLKNDIQTKPSYLMAQMVEEELRLVKSGKGYTLYINNQDSNLTASKLIDLIKAIKQEKHMMDINKIVLNRETVFNEEYITLGSNTKDMSDSILNIKI